jgi:flagellar hook-basal body complex protein FliE
MSIQFNPNLQSPAIQGPLSQPGIRQEGVEQTKFGDALLNSFRQVNQDQTESNQSIVDLLSGKQQDINTVVASMAKADMSFKLLVGVRNKLVEAYKETMRMQV